MYLMYYLNSTGDRVYTLSKTDPEGSPTFSAHPARFVHEFYSARKMYILVMFRFSPEDKYSRQRITIKKRFGLLLTQQPAQTY